MAVPPILCIVGPSGSGKTTLLERLIPALSAEGLKVGAIKHAASGPDILPAGKDSDRLAAAGAAPAIVAGPGGLAVQGQITPPSSPLELAAAFCEHCDLVLAEGFKRSAHDKILLVGPADESAPQDIPSVRLVVSDSPASAPGGLHRDDLAGIARWVLDWRQGRRAGEEVMGAILAGGRSRRMGRDKSAVCIAGRPVLARLAEVLADRLAGLWVIARPGGARPLPRCVRWHMDLREGYGPLGGIATALRIARASRLDADKPPAAVLVVACDMPLLGREVADLLLRQRRPGSAATALRNPQTNRLEPLAAVYELAALETIERAIDAGRLAVTELLEALGARELTAPPEIAEQLLNVNTPEELRRIEPEA